MLRAALVLALAAYGAAAAEKPFIDCSKEELVQAVPELAGVQFDANQDGLDALMRATGENLGNMFAMFAKLVDISAAEDIHEMRFEDGMGEMSRREAFRYVVKAPLPNGGQEQFQEFRIDANTKAPVQPPAHIDFLVIGRFLRLLNYFLPQYQGESRFRYMGRSNADGQDSFVVAFSQTGQAQGIAWMDTANKRIVRLRLDALGPIEGIPLETLTTDIALVPVSFSGRVLWLPARVTVHARYAGGELHSVHRYSDYQSESAKSAGIPAVAAASGEDAYELLARGITLIHDGKFGDAIAPLREALRINPAMPVGRFHLANALRTTGDMAGAEAELREAVKLVPDSGEVHNFLGIILSKRGDVPGSVAEFRKSAQLQPKQPIVHFNLAQALEKAGDRAAALEEYRTASELAPDNAAFKARYEQFERAANAPPAAAPETTIRVDVRQVLVPVVVTNKEGHHVTGLTQADFQVLEDGVEQKISAFSVEDAGVTVSAATTGVTSAGEPAAGQTAAESPATPKPTPARRTYVICIDSLHTEFGNLVQVRHALSKLFQSEQPGDSEYVLLAIGTSTQVVENTTSDPEKVLQAIESKDFQKLFLASHKSSMQSEILTFRRTLDEVRAACDAGQPECMRKSQLPGEANQIAAADRVYNMSFLSQFHALVQTLSRVPGRRTILFLSDGFQLVPGKEAFELLVAYFPELRSVSLRTVDRMTDLDPVLHLAANSNIPIYTIDSRGLYTSPFYDASNPGGSPRLMPAVSSVMDSNASEAGGTLSEMAAATGGTAFHNSNDLLTGMQRAFADGRQYYMLAYVAANSNLDGKFRAISVRLRDKKMVVKAKRGYWAAAN
jgi:VWFA-related protein